MMDKLKKNMVFYLLLLIDFYIVPWFIKNTGSAMIVMLVTRERKRRMGDALGLVGDSIGVEDKYGYVFNRVQTILWKQKEF